MFRVGIIVFILVSYLFGENNKEIKFSNSILSFKNIHIYDTNITIDNYRRIDVNKNSFKDANISLNNIEISNINMDSQYSNMNIHDRANFSINEKFDAVYFKNTKIIKDNIVLENLDFDIDSFDYFEIKKDYSLLKNARIKLAHNPEINFADYIITNINIKEIKINKSDEKNYIIINGATLSSYGSKSRIGIPEKCNGNNPCLDMFLLYKYDKTINKRYGDIVLSTYFKNMENEWSSIDLYANISFYNYNIYENEITHVYERYKTSSGTFGVFWKPFTFEYKKNNQIATANYGILIEGTGYQLKEEDTTTYKETVYWGLRIMFSRYYYFDILVGYDSYITGKRIDFKGEVLIDENLIVGASYNTKLENLNKNSELEQPRFNIYFKYPLSMESLKNIIK